MLLYQAPFLEVKDLIIFRDDKESNTFYYQCIQPGIVQVEGAPAFSAYAILPESGEAEAVNAVMDAGLSMEVNLKASEASILAAKEAIEEQWEVKDARLVPAPIAEGKVYLMMADAGKEPDPENWFVSSTVTPSLLGDNRATLVVKTSGENAKRLIAALDKGVVAGSIFFDLKILGISPSFNAKMTVDWSRVYHHFETFKKTNYIFVTEEINKSIDKLWESSAIRIEMQELDPDTQDYALKSMLNDLKNKILERLFKPAVPPLSASKKWEDRAISALSRFASSIIPGSHFQLRQVDEKQLFTATIDLNESRVKKYPFYPQALISSLISKAGGLNGQIHWIKLDDLAFHTETVDLALAADTFQTSNIKSVKLDCQVKNQTTDELVKELTLVFDKAENLKSRFSFIRQKEQDYQFAYKATIFLKDDNDTLPDQLEVDWQTTNSPFIYFNAAEYFETTELIVDIDDRSIYNFAPLIEVQIKVLEKESSKRITDKTFIFNNTVTEKQIFSFISTKEIPLQTDILVKYFLPNASDFGINRVDFENELFFIPNPFENKWSVDIISAVNWQDTAKVIAEFRVLDVIRGNYIKEQFSFTEQQQENIFRCTTSLETPDQELEVRFTVIGKDATVVRGPWTPHRGPVLVVKDQVKAERAIQALLESGPDFEEMEVKKVSIEFKYVDDQNGINIKSNRIEWEKIGDTVTFTHPMPNSNALEYRYRVRAYSFGGDSYRSKWTKSIQEDLSIALPEDIW